MPVSAAGRQWEECVFVCVCGRWVSEPPTGPWVLSLDSWHSADDRGGLVRLNIHHYYLLHRIDRFLDLHRFLDVLQSEDHNMHLTCKVKLF